MLKDPSGTWVNPSFRELEMEDFKRITHHCTYFPWVPEAYYEEGSRVFMCYLPGEDNHSLGFISLIPYEFDSGRGKVEVYMIESTYSYVGTHLVAWACKLGLEWFGEDSYYVMAVPKHNDAVKFFERIGAQEHLGDMYIFSDAAKKLVEDYIL
jgi:hypothetical protein